MKRACIIHDHVNLVLLPAIGGLTIAGLLGFVDPAAVTHAFLAYSLLDFVWVALQPDAVPSLPLVILFHHVVTAVLLAVPLAHPHLHWYTCVDGIVELNTLFLIARRCAPWRPVRTLCSWLYWGSFIPLRCILYPLMLPVFWREMQVIEHAPFWHTAACVGAQAILCAFNYVLLALSVMRARGRGSAGRDGKAAKPARDSVAATETAPVTAAAKRDLASSVRLRARTQ